MDAVSECGSAIFSGRGAPGSRGKIAGGTVEAAAGPTAITYARAGAVVTGGAARSR